MIQAIFKFLLNLLASLIQIVVWPLNALFTQFMPSVSEQITFVSSGISDLFSGFSWAMGLIPLSIRNTLLIVLTIEIAKHTIWANSYMITKVWLVLSKIKFW